MITNERQYKITRARLREFTEAVASLSELPKSREQPWLRAAQKESLQEQIDQLQKQIDEYEKLKAGKVKLPDPVRMVCETPLVLIQSRIAKGWDQEELATRLGMAKQQIQRYEQNGYAQATVSVLSRVAAVLAGQADPEARPVSNVQGIKPARSKTASGKSKARKRTRSSGTGTAVKRGSAKRKSASR